jgi:LmbE family N-acetylglucosaminyl deacetylase
VSVPWLVVSPHCDDGVFACGALLAMFPGSVVATVFSGSPPTFEPFTEWDRACGFAPGDDVMALRRDEDARALHILAAKPVWLPFLDSQYAKTPRAGAVADALRDVVQRCSPRAIAFPLGLFHSDHVLVREAMLQLAADTAMPLLVAYADALYRRIPRAMETQIAELAGRGFELRARVEPATPRARALKRAAVDCYGSQLRALATPGRLGHGDAYEAERYMDLTVTVTSL